nr:zinc finger, CCHC-type [Tanacetum cinerariifolium]
MATAMEHMALKFSKLDKFEGVDFRRWQKKMHFLLSSMSVMYVQTTPIPKDGGDDATVEQIRKRAKWDNDDYVYRGLILNVMEQYNELLGILGRFTQHKMNMDEVIQVYYVTYVSKAYFMKDDDVARWVDSGATVHVCKDRYRFKTYDLLNDGSILHMGNESTTLVHGCGCVDLRLNIVNDNTASAFMSTFKLNDSILWHTRLGHVHFKRMQDMSKDGLILAFDMDTEKFSINSIIESMDVIFDENRFASVPRPNLKIPNEIEDIGGLVVSEEVTKEKEAINDEMDFIMGNNTWLLADLPSGCKPLGSKWIFKRKLKVDGTIENFKARLVIQGFEQKSEIKYFDTYAPMARISTIRMLIAMASIHNLVIHQMDVNTTFLNGDLDKEVYMNQRCGFIMLGNEKLTLTKELLSSRFSVKDMGEADVILVSTPMDTSEKLMPNNGQAVSQLEYSRMIGCLMYTMTCTRPDIACVVGKLSRYTSNPVLEGYTYARWISNTEENSSTSGLVFLLGGAAGNEAGWLRNLVLEIPLWTKPIAPISIRCDSVATLAKAYSQMYNGKSRHLEILKSRKYVIFTIWSHISSPKRDTPPSMLRRGSPKRQQRSPSESPKDGYRVTQRNAPDRQMPRKETVERLTESRKASNFSRNLPHPPPLPKVQRVPALSPLPYNSPPGSVSPPAARRTPSKEGSPISHKRQRETMNSKDHVDRVELEENAFPRPRKERRGNKNSVNDKYDNSKYSPEKLTSHLSTGTQAQKRTSTNDEGKRKYSELANEPLCSHKDILSSKREQVPKKGHKFNEINQEAMKLTKALPTENASGVPQQFFDAKEEETRKKQKDRDRITRELKKAKEKEGRELDQEITRDREDHGYVHKRVKVDCEVNNVKATTLDPHSRRQTKFSSKWKVTDEKNGSRSPLGRRSRSPIQRRSRLPFNEGHIPHSMEVTFPHPTAVTIPHLPKVSISYWSKVAVPYTADSVFSYPAEIAFPHPAKVSLPAQVLISYEATKSKSSSTLCHQSSSLVRRKITNPETTKRPTKSRKASSFLGNLPHPPPLPKGQRVPTLSPLPYNSPASSVSPPAARRTPKLEEKDFSRPRKERRGNKNSVNDKYDNSKYSPKKLTSHLPTGTQAQKRTSTNDVGKRKYSELAHEPLCSRKDILSSKREQVPEEGFKVNEINQEVVKLTKALPTVERPTQSGSFDSGSKESDHKKKRKRSRKGKMSHQTMMIVMTPIKKTGTSRQTAKLKLKACEDVYPSLDLDKSHDSRKEALSDLKKLEIELREKAVESLRAKKGVGHLSLSVNDL